MIENQDIICISTSDWGRPWGSKQQLMAKLSDKNRVLYVEYQASFLHLLLRNRRIKRSFRAGMRRVGGNLFVFTPGPCLPFGYYLRWINKINQRIFLIQIKRAMREIGFQRPILWIYAPSAADALAALNAKLVLYHCIADFPAEKKSELRKKTLLSMERDLARESDIILAFTKALYERFKALNNSAYLFPSAADESLFSSERLAKERAPSDISALPRPRLGVIGYLDGKVLDIELLRHIADMRPEWSVVFIGPQFRDVNNLKQLGKRENVYFLGEKRHTDIPGYVKNLDVCLIPYLVNEFTNNISPLKLYEYMALGKPTVSTNLSGLADLKGFVKISDTKEGFVKEIALSLTEDNDELIHGRLNMAKENSWEKRLQFVSELIEMADKNRKG